MKPIIGRRMLVSTLLVTAAWATPAMAQQNPAQEQVSEGAVQETQTDGEIVVTGSRIRRPDLDSSSPVVVATAAEIGVSGNIANVENFLNELPQFVPGTTGASNNPGNGLATINLRGAGVTRTLVLVDGKRFIPSTLGGVIDINTIPTPLVERVDVVTGGASAVYGSDALAGVVNFILKKDFSGVAVQGQYNITERGDAANFTTNVTVGGNFDEGRGNAALFAGYTNRRATFASAREYSRVALLDSVPTTNAAGVVSGGCAAGSLNEFGLGARPAAGTPLSGRVPCFLPGGSTSIPATLLPGLPIGATTFNANGVARPYVDPDDLYNFAPLNYLQLPQERWQATALAHYEISPALVPFARASFSWNQVPRQLAPTPANNVFAYNLGNPFLTPSARDALCSAIDTNPAVPGVQSPAVAACPGLAAADTLVNVTTQRRLEEVGPRQNPQETYNYQIQLGLRGDLGSDWNYEAFYSYGRSVTNIRYVNDVSFERFQNAIQVVNVNGTPVCRDPIARAAGCVPINIFGAGNLSAAGANYIRLNAQSQTTVRDENAGASISGLLPVNLFTAEKVGLAAGVEYRSVGGRFDPDEALQRQVLGFNRTSPTIGNFNVKEVFGELSVPIAGGVSFIHDLRLTGAVRYSDYTTVGGVTTFRGAAEFAPIRDIRFRGEYQRAIRAPNIGELFAGQGNNFPSATDPCSAGQAAAGRTDAIRAACVASGVPAALVFVIPATQQVETIIGGNPNLGQETSETWTAGVVLSPRFLRGFNATVDYYNINIDNAISTFGGGTANILNTCYGPAVRGNPSSPYCAAVIRRADGTIQNVNSTNANVANLKFEGVDFALDYRTKFNFGLYDGETAVALITRGTRSLEQTSRADNIARILNCVGFYGPSCGNPTPKWRLNNSISMTSGPIGLTFQHRYFSPTNDDRQQVFPNPNAVPPIVGSFTPIDRPSSRIGDYNVFDASFNFDITDRYSFSFGVENIGDRQPPVVGDAADEQNNTYPSLFQAFGRSFFVGFRGRF